jgi:glycosyltransferase involved in cell wall biosynthesis
MAGQDKGLLQGMKDLARERRLEQSIRFPGFLDMTGKQREFSTHDIFLNTNRVDNTPVSVIEAAAFGLPIVATAVGGVPYLLEHEHTGLLVPDDDAETKTQAVIRLLQDAALATRLSQNARQWAEQFDWERVISQWESLFAQMMA